MNEPETCFESGGEEPPPGSQPWTMEYVARLFIEGGGFQGIANTHNAALERAKAETEPHLNGCSQVGARTCPIKLPGWLASPFGANSLCVRMKS
jgi:hypothetical protein